MLELRTPNLMFPLCRARVDTGRPEVSSRSGCRGFLGLVPQPLCMKSKVCSEEQTCWLWYLGQGRSSRVSSGHSLVEPPR